MCGRCRTRHIELFRQVKELVESMNAYITLVIVEGRHDEEALRRAGYRNLILRFSSSGMKLVEFVEVAMSKSGGGEVLVLTDFDDEGSEIAGRITGELEARGMKVSRRLREEWEKLLRFEGYHAIEALSAIKRKALGC